MRIIIDIPKEFEDDFRNNKFEDALNRLCMDAHLVAGNYERETAEMLIKAFDESKPMDMIVEELENYQNQHNAMCEQHKVKTIEDIYNKAIDDFVKECEKKLTDMILTNQGKLDFASGLAVANRMLDDVAEQLKAGGS